MTSSTRDESNVRQQSPGQAQRYLVLLREQSWEEWSALRAEDATVEFPFAPLTGQRVVHGRDAILASMASTTEPIAVDGVDWLRVHPMLDPALVVAELTIRGHLLANGSACDQKYVTVFRFDHGLIRHCREYWNPLVAIEALGGHEAWLAPDERRLAPATDAEPSR